MFIVFWLMLADVKLSSFTLIKFVAVKYVFVCFNILNLICLKISWSPLTQGGFLRSPDKHLAPVIVNID